MAVAGHGRPLLDRRVGLGGGVGHHRLRRRTRALPALLAGNDEGRVGRVGGAHLEHSASRSGGLPGLRNPGEVHEPVEHVRFDLRGGGGGGPHHPLGAEPRGRELAENRRGRRLAGEVREPARMLPVGQARDDDVVEITQQIGERLSSRRSMVREFRSDAARCDLLDHGTVLEARQVVGDPVDELVAVLPERVEVERIGSFCHSSPYRLTSPTTFSKSSSTSPGSA